MFHLCHVPAVHSRYLENAAPESLLDNTVATDANLQTSKGLSREHCRQISHRRRSVVVVSRDFSEKQSTLPECCVQDALACPLNDAILHQDGSRGTFIDNAELVFGLSHGITFSARRAWFGTFGCIGPCMALQL